jgi:hypothetical protein
MIAFANQHCSMIGISESAAKANAWC